MIRGYFSTSRGRRRPFVKALLQFPTLQNQSLEAEFLVDTGADRTVLAPLDAVRLARRFRVDLKSLPAGASSTGVGGRVATRALDAVIVLDSLSWALSLTVLEVPAGPIPTIPSLLGRDILPHFALFLEEQTQRLLLLEPREASGLPLPQ